MDVQPTVCSVILPGKHLNLMVLWGLPRVANSVRRESGLEDSSSDFTVGYAKPENSKPLPFCLSVLPLSPALLPMSPTQGPGPVSCLWLWPGFVRARSQPHAWCSRPKSLRAAHTDAWPTLALLVQSPWPGLTPSPALHMSALCASSPGS